MAVITNAQDYYAMRARAFKVADAISYMQQKGFTVEEVDLRDYSDPTMLKEKLAGFDIVWAIGGNTFNLRYEMRRSGFETIIQDLLAQGIVYGGDSAGALAAGLAINGIESADEPAYAPETINEGLKLVSFAILPHVDNPKFVSMIPAFQDAHKDIEVVELKDSQAIICTGTEHHIVEGQNRV